MANGNEKNTTGSGQRGIKRAVDRRHGQASDLDGRLPREERREREVVLFDVSAFDEQDEPKKYEQPKAPSAPLKPEEPARRKQASRSDADEDKYYSDEPAPKRRKRYTGADNNGEGSLNEPGSVYDEDDAAPGGKTPFEKTAAAFIRRVFRIKPVDKLDASGVDDLRVNRHYEKRRRQLRRDVIKIAALILSAVLLVVLAIVGYKLSIVRSVDVVGSKRYSSVQLVSLSGIRTGRSILGYSAGELREAMDGVTDVRTLSVKKAFPNKITISVEDLDARAAILAGDSSYVMITADGYVLNFSDNIPDGMLVILGMTNTGFTPHTYIDRTNATIRTSAAVRLLEAVDKSSIKDKLISIDLSNSACVSIELPGDYTVLLGSVDEAHECIETAAKAYDRFLPVYPLGGTINVFSGSSVVDFTPNRP